MTAAPPLHPRAKVSQELSEQLLGCLRGDWHSLVVVPADVKSSAMAVAEALAEASNAVRARPARVFSAEKLSLGATSSLIVEVTDHVERGGIAIVAIDPLVGRPTGMPLIMAADAALLCVHLGVTTAKEAKRTVELAGQGRFIGAVTVAPER